MPSNLFVMPPAKQASPRADSNRPALPVEYMIERGFTAQYCGPKGGDSLGNTIKVLTLGPGRYICTDPEIADFLDRYPGVSRRNN